MSVPGKPLRLLAALVLFSATMAVTASAAPADAAFKIDYAGSVYGDFLYAGNGVTRCPTDADHAPAIEQGTPVACANAANRAGGKSKDDFFREWADVDADPGTFDSAKATVTIPPGAKIVSARLNWAGDTGGYETAPGIASTTKLCNSGNVSAIPPPGTPATQSVRLKVGAGKSSDIAPFSYSEDAPGAFTGAQYYSAFADVTGSFAGAATGSPLDVVVGNVWTPRGFGCFGGWSLALVYAYPERNPAYAPDKRAVFVYDGHLRQRDGRPAAVTTITGFRASSADAHIGVTAYGADATSPGDRFLIDDTATAEPATGSTTNFFIGDADNASDPAVKNNFSVDAKSFNTDAVPAGATSAKIGFATSGDKYLAQNLAFSVPVPDLQVAVHADPHVAHVGDDVTYTVVVSNPGSDATDVEVTDDEVPACAKKIGALGGGKTTTYTCSAAAPAADLASTAKATGKSSFGDALDGAATTDVDVIHPAVAITEKADKAAYRQGDSVTLGVVVTNSGDVPLTSVKVADAKTAACARDLPGTLGPGQSSTFTCTTKAPLPGGQDAVSVTAVDPLGRQTGASTQAPVPTIAPALQVTKTAAPPVVHAGEAVTWTVAVHNTGDSPLSAVKLTDDTTTSCSRGFDALAPGASQTYTCTSNPAKTAKTTVTANALDLSGQAVSASADATVTVLNPALTLTKEAYPAVVRLGDQITFTLTVGNAGDAPLTNIAVTDDHTPACAKTLGTLAVGASQKYTCSTASPADDFTNTATATGQDQLGHVVKVTADAAVDVIHPDLALQATAAPPQVRTGDPVTFTVTVRNPGDVPLTAVKVADPLAPDCAKSWETLAPQGEQTYTCTTKAGADGFTNTLTVSGADPTHRGLQATGEAAFTVQHPAVAVAMTTGGPFRAGDTVPFHVVVRNPGDVPLTAVTTTDTQVPACAQTAKDPLAPGASWAFDCTGKAPADDFTTTLGVAAKPPVGALVAASSSTGVDVVHPALALAQTAAPKQVHAGDAVTFTITVTNGGDTPLHDVGIADPLAPGCVKTVGILAPQANRSYPCTLTAGPDDFTNTAQASGTDPTNRPVTAAADAAVDVVHPALALTQTAAPGQVRPGDPVTFTIDVRNSGDVPLTQLSIVDDRTPSCAHDVAGLAAGADEHYTCTTKAGDDGYTNTAKATGTDPTGRAVSASGDAAFSVVHPGLAVAAAVKGGPFRQGDAVTFTVTVTNTGDTPLTAVAVTDEGVPACARTFDLAAGAKQVYDCGATAPADDLLNVVKASGKPPVGAPVSASGQATADVIHPALTVTLGAAHKTVRAGDGVVFTVVVTNTGDVPLTKVTVADDRAKLCARTYDALAAGEVQTYQCTVEAPKDDFTDVARVTGADPTARPVDTAAALLIDVVHPEIAIMQDAEPYQVHAGATVTFSVLVKNTGDVALADVSVADDRLPACAHTVPALAADAEVRYSCTTVAGAQGFENTTTVTGTDPTARTVTASDQASFEVVK